MAVETYDSYFGPFSVNEEEGYLVIGSATRTRRQAEPSPAVLRADRHAPDAAAARRN